MIRVQRVYGSDAHTGEAFLIDRVWPRGVRKDDLEMTAWLKDIAPSTELRKWFGHRPERFEEFRRRYRDELADHDAEVERLTEAARHDDVTLLYSAKDEQHNNAVVIKEFLDERLAG